MYVSFSAFWLHHSKKQGYNLNKSSAIFSWENGCKTRNNTELHKTVSNINPKDRVAICIAMGEWWICSFTISRWKRWLNMSKKPLKSIVFTKLGWMKKQNDMLKKRYINYITSVSRFYYSLSYDVAPGTEITPCNKIDKPLVVYRFLGNVMTFITTFST